MSFYTVAITEVSGAHVVPAMPAFYHHSMTIDDLGNVFPTLIPRWGHARPLEGADGT